MKELDLISRESYEAPIILEILPMTVVHGEESGSPIEEPEDPGSSIPD